MDSVNFLGIRLDARDVVRTSTFWADLLGWTLKERADGAVAVIPNNPTSYPLAVRAASAPKNGQNRIHFDLTSMSSEDMQQLISRAHVLGAADVDIGQSSNEPHRVLADPEGNEFCVIPPESTFLANTGAIGAINCDGSQAVGYFWSDALGWPLVWDRDQETAIQSPAGGSKITWSGPPLMPREGRDRLRFELSTSGSMSAAIARLTALGAHVANESSSTEGILHDPDGNEFHLLAMQHME
ncbi:conserved hypothetical protein [Nostocoides japonicum T1-X7]|uniref:Glyoxalase-like domain-containing protein n=1 Tax=Nostocoides japonicum T1-X7 TaxID=1194083 RepID=A0A077LU17_9MICO|nr:VOC family protein [Tetrasphaera japonica]CCH77173.1 conserved hypothetical protein [Tetrasphaera japonica T1-X7]